MLFQPRAVAEARLFYFYIFLKLFYRNIFSISQFTVLYPYRPAGGGRDLYVNKNNFYLRGGPWRGGLPPGRGAAGSPSPQNCNNGPLDVVLDILDTNKNH